MGNESACRQIRILDDMIEYVNQFAPPLVPLFRSEQQMRLLGILFGGPNTELSIGELAELADVAQATASREVARLAAHGIVEVRALGRNTLVAPNWDLPWAQELRSILVQTVGVLGRVRDALAGLAGVEAAFIFGSWAARYRGEPGPAPRDIDLLVVGDVAVRDVRAACRGLDRDLRVEVNPVVVDRAAWEASPADPFVEEVRSSPLVPVTAQRPDRRG